ncbi:MAG: MFS transporter, partial [Alphaproteobacteria bacterium]
MASFHLCILSANRTASRMNVTDNMNQNSGSPLAKTPFFYGWVVVGVAFVTMAFGVNARTSFSLMVPPLSDEFGWDRATIAGIFSIGFVTSTALSPLIGELIGRLGPRYIMPVCVLVMGAGFALAPLASEPWHLYVTLGAMVVGGSVGVSYIGHSFFLPNWFVRKRGLAIGIAFSGVGVGSILLFPWLQRIIESAGWREACFTLAVLIIVVLVPLNYFLQRGRPEDIGLRADGRRDGDDDGAGAGDGRDDNIVDGEWAARRWTLGLAIRTARFWWLAGAFFCGLFAWYAVLVHQTKFLLDLGFSSELTAFALGLVSFAAIFGQIAIGAISDRLGREVAWTLSMAGFVLCYALLLWLKAEPGLFLVYAMVVAQGFIGYGMASVYGSVAADVFSGPRYAAIFGVLGLLSTLGAAAGPWAVGRLYDLHGDYTLGFAMCAAMAVASVFCMWAAAPRRVRLVAGQAVRR